MRALAVVCGGLISAGAALRLGADVLALFQHLSREAPEYSAEFLQSHPLSGKRAQNFARSFDPRAHYEAVLSRDQSAALFDICRKGPAR
jgi:hypothetical protein